MDFLGPLFKSIEIGLSIWQHKLKREYLEKLAELKRRISNEEAEPLDKRDQNVIDRCHRDLMLLLEQWSAQVTGPDSSDKPGKS